jgi:hypothetical protein
MVGWKLFVIKDRKALQTLVLNDNFFTGSISLSMGNCPLLEISDTRSNFFNGIIPESVYNIANITDLRISSNFLLEQSHILRSINQSYSVFIYSELVNWFYPKLDWKFDKAFTTVRIV